MQVKLSPNTIAVLFVFRCLLLSLAPNLASAQDQELESWKVEGRDCPLRVVRIEEGTSEETGESMAQFHFTAGNGTFAHCGFALPPARVIDELALRVRIKADHAGLQFLARVVLPRDVDPSTNTPLTVLLQGDTYQEIHNEQVLWLTDVPKQLEEHLRVLRIERRQPIDGREAFVDRVLVNIYGGPGESHVALGKPNSLGMADPLSAGAAREMGIQRLGAEKESPAIHIDGNLLRVGEQPLFVRAVDDNGEPWDELRSMGFNTIRLRRSPCADDFSRADSLDLRLVAPFPLYDAWMHLRYHSRSIIAWEWNEVPRHTQGTLPLARDATDVEKVLAAMRSKTEWSRPILANPSTSLVPALRPDILLLPNCTSPTADRVTNRNSPTWLRQASAASWRMISTEPPAIVVRQIRGLGYRGPDITLEPEAIEGQIMAAIQEGARGLAFGNDSKLTTAESSVNLRQLALQCALARLELAEPWLAASQEPIEVPCTPARYRAVAFPKNQAMLLVVRSLQSASEAPHQVRRAIPMSFTVPGCTPDTLAFRISAAGLEPLTVVEGAGGLRIEIQDPDNVEFVLTTRSSEIVILTAKKCAADGLISLQRELRLATLVAEETERFLRELPAATGIAKPWSPVMEQVYGDLGRCRHSLTTAQWMEASAYLRSARRGTSQIRAGLLSPLPNADLSAQSNPLTFFISTMVSSRQLMSQWYASSWSPLREGCSEFDTSGSIVEYGWRAFDTKVANRHSRVAIAIDVRHSGSGCLSLESGLESATVPHDRGSPEIPAAWVTSPSVRIPAGKVVRLEGFVLVADDSDEEPVRLVISESLGGPDLALAIPANSNWQPFVLFRATDTPVEWSLSLSLAGTGKAYIDQVTTSICNVQPTTFTPQVETASHRPSEGRPPRIRPATWARRP